MKRKGGDARAHLSALPSPSPAALSPLCFHTRLLKGRGSQQMLWLEPGVTCPWWAATGQTGVSSAEKHVQLVGAWGCC